MKGTKLSILFLNLLISSNLWAAFGSGWSTYPMLIDNRFLSTELTGDLSNDGGLGFQGRYIHKVNKATVIDGGLGFSGGERSGRIFASVDYELFPDYMKQPKVSFKAGIENSREYDQRNTKISFTPLVSKGFNFWGKEAYPYAAFPMGVSLENNSKSYETFMNLSLGITGKLPIKNFTHLTANFEGTLNIKDSSSGVFLGIAFPLHSQM